MYCIYDVTHLDLQKIHAKLEIFPFHTYYCLPFVTKKVIEDKTVRIIFLLSIGVFLLLCVKREKAIKEN